MILRRFMKHVSDQNWFAVGLDVLVVIVGIFLGMQVTEWNEGRKQDDRARQVEIRLKANLLDDASGLEERLIYWERTINYGKQAIVWLETGEPGGSSNWETLLALYQASNQWRYAPNTTTFNELQSAGEMELIQDADLREDIAQYYNIIGSRRSGLIYDNVPEYRSVIRGNVPFDTALAIQDNCHINPRSQDQQMTDCSPVISEDAAAAVLASIAADPIVLKTLRYWINSAKIGADLARLDIEFARSLAARLEGEAP